MTKENQPLERASLEAYGGIVCGIIGAVMASWWIKTGLLALAAALLTHSVFRSKKTIAWQLYMKLGVSAILAVLLFAIGWQPIWDDLHKQYPNITFNWPVTFGAHDAGTLYRTSHRTCRHWTCPARLSQNGGRFFTFVRSLRK
jgi:polyferredoxin